LHDRAVGTFFFAEGTITVEVFLDLLEKFVFPIVDDIESEQGTGVAFQQDGAAPNFSIYCECYVYKSAG
jgi:hypothetical protein